MQKVQQIPGCPILRAFAKGGIPRISIPTVVYPTLCKERKGWGTRLFVVLPAVPNTHGGLIQDSFLEGPAVSATYTGSSAFDDLRTDDSPYWPARGLGTIGKLVIRYPSSRWKEKHSITTTQQTLILLQGEAYFL